MDDHFARIGKAANRIGMSIESLRSGNPHLDQSATFPFADLHALIHEDEGIPAEPLRLE